jgi:two-component system NtrC family sensor kinase
MLETQLAQLQPSRQSSAADRLGAMFSLSSALLVTRDMNDILTATVREGMALFPGTGGALIFLADEHDGSELELRAAHSSYVPQLKIASGQGAIGRVFLAPRSMLIVGPELELTEDELGAEQTAVMRALIQPWPPSSALLAPIRFEQQRLGALVLYGGTHAHLLHPRDLPFVQALADLAAVALTDRRAHERTAALQRDLVTTRSLHAEVRAHLDAAQAQLLQSAKLAAVGELAASIAHEINNPLYAARNSLYLVEQDTPANSPAHEFLTIAQDELARIGRIIERMRDFYRPSRIELAFTDVNQILEETIDLVQTHLRHGRVNAVLQLSPALPALIAHADQLRQVFLNLILNACDAMPQGGTLTITTLVMGPEADEPGRVRIEVRDTGGGIAEEHLTHLFEPFYTTKAQGTGLGLAISAHIVTQHGGTIDVLSTPGEGTVFTVVLPLDTPHTLMAPEA